MSFLEGLCLRPRETKKESLQSQTGRRSTNGNVLRAEGNQGPALLPLEACVNQRTSPQTLTVEMVFPQNASSPETQGAPCECQHLSRKAMETGPKSDICQSWARAPEFRPPIHIWLWVKTNGIPFWGRCTTHFRTYFSGDWDVHWGLTDLAFDPWPYVLTLFHVSSKTRVEIPGVRQELQVDGRFTRKPPPCSRCHICCKGTARLVHQTLRVFNGCSNQCQNEPPQSR